MVSWRDPQTVILTKPNTIAQVDPRFATLEGVLYAINKSSDRMDSRATIDRYVRDAFCNNKWLKEIITLVTEGAWDKQIKCASEEIVSYSIDNKILLTILSHVIAYYSTPTNPAEQDTAEAKRNDDLVKVYYTLASTKDRKSMCRAGDAMNTVLSQLSTTPEMLVNLYRSSEDGLSEEQALKEAMALEELADKFSDIRAVLTETKERVRISHGIVQDHAMPDHVLKAKYGLSEDTSIMEYLENTPFKVRYLELRVQALKATHEGTVYTNAKKDPLAPKLVMLIESTPFEEHDPAVLTEEALESLKTSAYKLYMAGTMEAPAGVDQANTQKLLDQIHEFVVETAVEYTLHNRIKANGTLVNLRPMPLFVLHKILSPADQSSVEAPSSQIKLSTRWSTHPQASVILRWLTAVNKEALATRESCGFYLVVQPIDDSTRVQWNQLLTPSKHIFNEVLDGVFVGHPEIQLDVLYIIANAWGFPPAKAGRNEFEAALGIKRTMSTVTAETPPVNHADGMETEDEEEEDVQPKKRKVVQENSDDEGHAEGGHPGGAKKPKDDRVEQIKESVRAALQKRVGNIKLVTGFNPEIRKEVNNLIDMVQEPTWAKTDDRATPEGILAEVHTDTTIDAFLIAAAKNHGHTWATVMVVHAIVKMIDKLNQVAVANNSEVDPKFPPLITKIADKYGKQAQ